MWGRGISGFMWSNKEKGIKSPLAEDREMPLFMKGIANPFSIK
jgi:hypothetical protein